MFDNWFRLRRWTKRLTGRVVLDVGYCTNKLCCGEKPRRVLNRVGVVDRVEFFRDAYYVICRDTDSSALVEWQVRIEFLTPIEGGTGYIWENRTPAPGDGYEAVAEFSRLRRDIFERLDWSVAHGYEVRDWPAIDIVADLQAFADDLPSADTDALLPHVTAWLETQREEVVRRGQVK